MTLYSKGDKVIRVSSNDKGIIVAIGPCGRGGRQLYRVNFKGIETDELEGNLMFNCDVSDPFERCKNNIFGSYIEFLKINTTFKIRNSNISTISSLKASKTLFRAYQFKPLLKFLNSDNKRILVADEVGLGKTIEAGHIMLELKVRNEFKNAVVICPISLQKKWKDELKDKFGLTFTIIDSAKEFVRLLQDQDGHARIIMNYEKIRSKTDSEKQEEKNSILQFLKETSKKFSFVLCDEAHKMRNSTTQTYKGAEMFMENADAAVFLTATPIMVSTENLYNLLHLLDNQRYTNKSIFEQNLQENRPFIKALSELSIKLPLTQIAENLCEAEITLQLEVNERIYTETHVVNEHFKDFPLFKRIIARMQNEEDSLMLRSQLQYDIMAMSQMNQVFSRTRKREITTDWSQAERRPHTTLIELAKDERERFDEVINEYVDDNSYIDSRGEQHLTQGGALGLVQKKRQVASSVYGYLNDRDSLTKGIDAYSDFEDAKFNKLLNIIQAVFKHEIKKLIVFALFKNTLNYLNIRLNKAGYRCVMIYGDIADRQNLLDLFRDDPSIDILLSSEVGSEGLDMQFCSSMVNYDLPWNPMIVEQRIGRVDRFGQHSPIVNIYNLIVKDSIQEDIYVRLLERIGVFRDSIGDMEAILDAEIEKSGTHQVVSLQTLYSGMEKELFCTHLSREERQKKIDEIAQAFINEKENIKKIEEGLTNTLTNDAYFRNEINRIVNNNAYVTEFELKAYIDQLITENITTCHLEEVEKGIFEIQQPKSNSKILSNFLSQYQPTGVENDILFRQFRNLIDGNNIIKLTFNQEIAYKHRELIFVNLYNPIIQAAMNYFLSKNNESCKTFKFSLSKEEVPDFHVGTYFLAIYQIESSKKIFGQQKISNTLYPVLFDTVKDRIINNEDATSRFYGQAQVKGAYVNADDLGTFSMEILNNMQLDLAENIADYRNKNKNEMMLQAENASRMTMQQTEAYYKYRIRSLEDSIRNTKDKLEYAIIINEDKEIRSHENTLRLLNYNLNNVKTEMENELKKISEDPEIDIKANLLSINLINVK